MTVARRLARLLIVALLLATVTAAAAPARAQDAEAEGDPALDRLATCVRDRGRLLVLLLVDESGSLRQTDPGDQRVTAARTALRSFAALGSAPVAGRQTQVEVALAGFSAEFATVADWSALVAASLEQTLRAADSFAERDRGLDTDFATALAGAQQSLAQRSAVLTQDGSPAPCKALLLFTDGEYSVEARDSAEVKAYAPELPLDIDGNAALVVARGRAALCSPDGIADRLAGDDVVTVTIALSTQIPQADRTFLESLSTGAAAGSTCGVRVDPPRGTYLGSEQLSGLLTSFDGVANEIAGGSLAPGGPEAVVCPRTSCPEGRREFVVDPTLRAFHVLADLGASGVVVELLPPTGGEPLILTTEQPLRAKLGGVDLTVTPLSPTALTVDARLAPDDRSWAGTWTATFVDPTGSNPDAVTGSQIYLYGALQPELIDPPRVRLGDEAALTVALVSDDGSAIGPEAVAGRVELLASAEEGPDGPARELTVAGPDGDGRYRVAYAPGAALERAAVTLVLELRVETRARVELSPVTRTYEVSVLPPATYPSLTPSALRLSSVTGAGTATGTLTLRGGEDDGGCVWFEGITFSATPAGAEFTPSTTPGATDAQRCVPLAAGEERTVDVEVASATSLSGSVQGEVRAHLLSEADDRELVTEVPLTFELARPVNQALRAELFVALLAIGLLIPIVLLWLVHRVQATFPPPAHLRGARVPVTVRGEQVYRDGRLLELRAEDFSAIAEPATAVRAFAYGGVVFRTKVPWAPWGLPRAVVSGPGLVGGTVPMGLAGAWAFTLGPDVLRPEADEDAELPGVLVALLPEGAFDDHGRELVEQISDRLPAVAAMLGAKAPASAPAPPEQEQEAALVPGPAWPDQPPATPDY